MTVGSVSIRLIAPDQKTLQRAVTQLSQQTGAQFGSVPNHPGRKGDWLAYGSCEVYIPPERAPEPPPAHEEGPQEAAADQPAAVRPAPAPPPVDAQPSRYGVRSRDGRLGCMKCRRRYAPQLMHRVVWDGVQAETAKRDRDGKPVWLCGDCWTRRFNATPRPAAIDELDAEDSGGQVPYEYLIELVCLHCTHRIGDVVAGDPQARIVVPAHVRCVRCGGPAITSGEVRRRFAFKQEPAAGLIPQRGRPPKAKALGVAA